jgi:AcrR family transcriptional regulator
VSAESTVIAGEASTRLRLLEAAEQLYAEQGIDAVSLRQVAAVAGQRNTSAVAYHVGSRDALVRAVLGMRLQVTDARRQELLAAAFSGERPEVRDLVEALVLPFAETLNEPWGRAHVRFVAQMRYWPGTTRLSLPGGEIRLVAANAFRTLDEIESRLVDLPAEVVDARLLLTRYQTVDGVVAWSHDPSIRGGALDLAVVNFVDMLSAALLAPVSRRTLEVLGAAQRVGSGRSGPGR